MRKVQSKDRYANLSGERTNTGSRMPLNNDLDGWDWRNPLNALPVGILVMVIASVILTLGPFVTGWVSGLIR